MRQCCSAGQGEHQVAEHAVLPLGPHSPVDPADLEVLTAEDASLAKTPTDLQHRLLQSVGVLLFPLLKLGKQPLVHSWGRADPKCRTETPTSMTESGPQGAGALRSSSARC